MNEPFDQINKNSQYVNNLYNRYLIFFNKRNLHINDFDDISVPKLRISRVVKAFSSNILKLHFGMQKTIHIAINV